MKHKHLRNKKSHFTWWINWNFWKLYRRGTNTIHNISFLGEHYTPYGEMPISFNLQYNFLLNVCLPHFTARLASSHLCQCHQSGLELAHTCLFYHFKGARENYSWRLHSFLLTKSENPKFKHGRMASKWYNEKQKDKNNCKLTIKGQPWRPWPKCSNDWRVCYYRPWFAKRKNKIITGK